MSAWWNSLEIVSSLSTVSQWLVACAGIAALVLGMRTSTLQDEANRKEKADTAAEVAKAQDQAAESLAKIALQDEAILKERQATAAEVAMVKAQAAESLAKIAPRTITAAQRAAFVAASAAHPKGLVVIIPLAGQAEPTHYSEAVQEMLLAAGYTVEVNPMMPMGSVTGAGLTVKPGEAFPEHTEGLLAAFEAAGIPMGTSTNGLQRDGVLGLVVGAKP